MSPGTSKVNFVTPNVKSLRDFINTSGIKCSKPGILETNLDLIAKMKGNQSFKLCVDGKKISSGFGQILGDVDLFGFEDDPSLKEREVRLDEELSNVRDIENILEKISLRDVVQINAIQEDQQLSLRKHLLSILKTASKRLQELRLIHVKKRQALEHLMTSAGPNWKESKLSFAVSSVRTNLYRIKECISGLVHHIDQISYFIACLNKTGHMYCLNNSVDLGKQHNYVCLLGLNDTWLQDNNDSQMVLQYAQFVKQRTNVWFNLRKLAKVTGSTFNKALGLEGLKSQLEHFDRLFCGKQTEPSAAAKAAMNHGQNNEINAVATIVGKILPVLHPEMIFFETGCYVLQHENKPFIVVSPDGQGKSGANEHCLAAFEIKCPVPGKKFTPDVHYYVPKYYIPQLISEMKVLGSSQLYYVCYTKETTTVFRVNFSEELWGTIWDLSVSLYGGETQIRPKRKHKDCSLLADQIASFQQNNIEFVGEFPSVSAISCVHKGLRDPHQVYGYHKDLFQHIENFKVNSPPTIQEMQQNTYGIQNNIKEAYQLLRTPAKEVLVALITDVDRIKSPSSDVPHAVPVAYGLSGYSLKVENVRDMIYNILMACKKRKLHVPVISFDGQFYKIAVRSKTGKPLTLLQLQKDVWQESKKMTKAQQINYMMQANEVSDVHDFATLCRAVDIKFNHTMEDGLCIITGPIDVGVIKTPTSPPLLNPPGIAKWILQGKRCKQNNAIIETENTDEVPLGQQENIILNCLPAEVLANMDDNLLSQVEELSKQIMTRPSTKDDCIGINETDISPMTEDAISVDEYFKTPNTYQPEEDKTFNVEFDIILEALRENSINDKSAKWNNTSSSALKEFLANAETIKSAFTSKELQIMITCIQENICSEQVISKTKYNKSTPKFKLVNLVSEIMGDKSKVKHMRRCKVKKLRHIIRDYINRNFSKTATNIIVATNEFHQKRVPAWRHRSLFGTEAIIGHHEDPYYWYSQPEYEENLDQTIYALLDCHHLFVNARTTICSRGLPQLGIHKEAWLEVAKDSKENQTGLSYAMVADLIDRQSNAYAQKTFSEAVEVEMRKNGRTNEANFCRIFRQWYQSEDEAGIPAEKRHDMRLKLRELFLRDAHLGEFPPPGSHVGGIPIVMFEGIMTNIDRRAQLYSEVKDGCYNVRAIGSLDAETFFSGFQDLDPKGTGVLLPDDIPKVMEAASYIVQCHLDQDRYDYKNFTLVHYDFC